MPRRPALATAILLGLTVVGVAIGHGVTYAGLEPAAVVREAWLAATGHGYLPAAWTIAFAAGVTIAGWLILRGAVRGGADGHAPTLGRLVAVEVAGFLLLELVERGVAGAGFADLARVLPVGLAIQSAIACLLAIAARLLLRSGASAAARLTAAARPPSARPVLVVALPAGPTLDSLVARGPLGGRAPPSSR